VTPPRFLQVHCLAQYSAARLGVFLLVLFSSITPTALCFSSTFYLLLSTAFDPLCFCFHSLFPCVLPAQVYFSSLRSLRSLLQFRFSPMISVFTSLVPLFISLSLCFFFFGLWFLYPKLLRLLFAVLFFPYYVPSRVFVCTSVALYARCVCIIIIIIITRAGEKNRYDMEGYAGNTKWKQSRTGREDTGSTDEKDRTGRDNAIVRKQEKAGQN
jgi:hypothetical protein